MSIPSDPSPAHSSGELPIIEACLDLIRWFVPLLQRLPRQHRFGLGDRLISHLYHMLEQLVLARYARAKLPFLEPLKAHYEQASRLYTAIAKQHSGWLSQQLQQQPTELQHA